MDINAIQEAIRQAGIDGWLFYDFHNRDPIAYRILGLDFERHTSRRWFYFIPAHGEPTALLSRVEPARLNALSGQRIYYRSWRGLDEALANMVGKKTVAMQISPDIPYVSLVDAGTMQRIQNAGATIVSSADLVQQFEAILDDDAYESHVEAGRRIHRIKDEAFGAIATSLQQNKAWTEYDVQQFIVRRFEEEGLDCSGGEPIVGVNDHPADPHFQPTPDNAVVIRQGDTILIDLWAKLRQPNSIFYDITWCGYAGKNPPKKYQEIFSIACDARDAAVDFVRKRFANNEPCYGYEVDDATRNVIEKAGYGEFFVHRTGHSIGQNVHGNGANIDNLETKDSRRLVPGLCFSIEPGIYLPQEMAVRTEINVFIRKDGVEVTGEVQKTLICIE